MGRYSQIDLSLATTSMHAYLNILPSIHNRLSVIDTNPNNSVRFIISVQWKREYFFSVFLLMTGRKSSNRQGWRKSEMTESVCSICRHSAAVNDEVDWRVANFESKQNAFGKVTEMSTCESAKARRKLWRNENIEHFAPSRMIFHRFISIHFDEKSSLKIVETFRLVRNQRIPHFSTSGIFPRFSRLHRSQPVATASVHCRIPAHDCSRT